MWIIGTMTLKDPYSSAAMTERQAAYEGALGLKTPYTPQIIVDGTAELRINDAQQMDKTLHDAVAEAKIPVHIGEVNVDATNPTILRTRIETGGKSDNGNADISAPVALDHLESQVLHG